MVTNQIEEGRLNLFSATFRDAQLEQDFRSSTLSENYIIWRWLHILALLVFASFASLNAYLLPQHAWLCMLIAFGIIGPMFLTGFALSFTAWYRARWQAASFLYVLTAGAGALAIVDLLGRQVHFYSLTGLIFCYLFGFTLIHLRFLLATAAGSLLSLGFLAYAFFFAPPDPGLRSLGVLYVLGVQALGMIVSYNLDRSRRQTFFKQGLLRKQQLETERANQSLEAKVFQRTRDLQSAYESLLSEVTERKRLVDERDDLQKRYSQSQKLEIIGRLAGGVAHDFNNLLTIIEGFAGLIDEDLRVGDPMKSYLQEILTASHRAADLTHQLLAFSRKQVLEPRVLDINEVIHNLEKMLKRLIGEDISLKTSLQENLDLILADPSQIEQVVMNLAVNARDAMPKGGKLTIETSEAVLDEESAAAHPETQAGQYVLLSVSDNGTGMGEDVKQKIFEPFFTTKESGQGTGLGLSTVYGIVKQSGGSISVHSEPGQGSCFKIYFPRAEADQPTPHEIKEKGRTCGTETILVVEDEEALRVLFMSGYTDDAIVHHGVLDG